LPHDRQPELGPRSDIYEASSATIYRDAEFVDNYSPLPVLNSIAWQRCMLAQLHGRTALLREMLNEACHRPVGQDRQ
jgi:hypothetical protein